jgi:Asp-tRNA(Asn)/Glu-tRNA(Gln) amidotransferase A subunit family amidase
LIVQHTKAWETEVDTATRAAFDGLLERLRKRDVELATRRDDARYAELEDAFFGPFIERSIDINSYEMRWPYEQYVESRGAELEKRQHTRVARAREMTPEYYAELLVEKASMKEKARLALSEADAVLTLSSSGPAPVGHSHTGSRAYLLFATFLQLPAISLPHLQSDGMPVGVQLIGHSGGDGDLCALANWLQSV